MSQLNGLDNAYKFTLFSGGLTGAAVTGQFTTAVGNAPGAKYLLLQAVISGLDGGTSANFIIQTTVDDSAHWHDIASFAFSTGTSGKVHGLFASAVANMSHVSGVLSANSLNQGILGDQYRVFYGTAGTYSAGTVVIIGLAKS
jgi:hypothetical protein